jgi:hypothetical protein
MQAKEATMSKIERNDHLTELVVEIIDAEGKRCAECHDTAQGDRLFVYYTRHGSRQRRHDGLFCSKDCHDIYHGLKSRRFEHLVVK